MPLLGCHVMQTLTVACRCCGAGVRQAIAAKGSAKLHKKSKLARGKQVMQHRLEHIKLKVRQGKADVARRLRKSGGEIKSIVNVVGRSIRDSVVGKGTKAKKDSATSSGVPTPVDAAARKDPAVAYVPPHAGDEGSVPDQFSLSSHNSGGSQDGDGGSDFERDVDDEAVVRCICCCRP